MSIPETEAGHGARHCALTASHVVVDGVVAPLPAVKPVPWARSQKSWSRSAQTLRASPAAAPSGTLTALLSAAAVAALVVLPGLNLLYALDQESLLPARAPTERAA